MPVVSIMARDRRPTVWGRDRGLHAGRWLLAYSSSVWRGRKKRAGFASSQILPTRFRLARTPPRIASHLNVSPRHLLRIWIIPLASTCCVCDRSWTRIGCLQSACHHVCHPWMSSYARTTDPLFPGDPVPPWRACPPWRDSQAFAEPTTSPRPAPSVTVSSWR